MIAESRLSEIHLSKIADACRTNDVSRLELFGSRTRNDVVSDSDADFVVEFVDPLRPGVFDRFLALREALQRILGCPIDLIEASSIQNPVLRQHIDEDKQLIYAA